MKFESEVLSEVWKLLRLIGIVFLLMMVGMWIFTHFMGVNPAAIVSGVMTLIIVLTWILRKGGR